MSAGASAWRIVCLDVDYQSGMAVGGGKVTVEHLLDAERGGRHVDCLFDLEGQLGRSDLVDAGADSQQASAVGEATGVLALPRSGGQLCGDDLVRALWLESREQGVKEQGREITDGVAPRPVMQRCADRLDAGGRALRLGGDEHDPRAGIVRAASGIERGRSAGFVGDRHQ